MPREVSSSQAYAGGSVLKSPGSAAELAQTLQRVEMDSLAHSSTGGSAGIPRPPGRFNAHSVSGDGTAEFIRLPNEQAQRYAKQRRNMNEGTDSSYSTPRRVYQHLQQHGDKPDTQQRGTPRRSGTAALPFTKAAERAWLQSSLRSDREQSAAHVAITDGYPRSRSSNDACNQVDFRPHIALLQTQRWLTKGAPAHASNRKADNVSNKRESWWEDALCTYSSCSDAHTYRKMYRRPRGRTVSIYMNPI